MLADWNGFGGATPGNDYALLTATGTFASVSIFPGGWPGGAQDGVVGHFMVRTRNAVPEPTSLMLIALAGLAAWACARRPRRHV